MRLWSLHPKYLDRAGLLACWRETLLAQKVLQGGTKGYRHHPQLRRFQACLDPLAAIGGYLVVLAEEAEKRGYRFDRTKINPSRQIELISVTLGQLSYEWSHLKKKLLQRDPHRYQKLEKLDHPDPHPSFKVVDGDIECWEKTQGSDHD